MGLEEEDRIFSISHRLLNQPRQQSIVGFSTGFESRHLGNKHDFYPPTYLIPKRYCVLIRRPLSILHPLVQTMLPAIPALHYSAIVNQLPRPLVLAQAPAKGQRHGTDGVMNATELPSGW